MLFDSNCVTLSSSKSSRMMLSTFLIMEFIANLIDPTKDYFLQSLVQYPFLHQLFVCHPESYHINYVFHQFIYDRKLVFLLAHRHGTFDHRHLAKYQHFRLLLNHSKMVSKVFICHIIDINRVNIVENHHSYHHC